MKLVGGSFISPNHGNSYLVLPSSNQPWQWKIHHLVRCLRLSASIFVAGEGSIGSPHQQSPNLDVHPTILGLDNAYFIPSNPVIFHESRSGGYNFTGFSTHFRFGSSLNKVYAWELNARNISASAYRLGELNPETSYVLQALKVPVPPLLEQLLPEVAVVDTNNPEEQPEVRKTWRNRKSGELLWMLMSSCHGVFMGCVGLLASRWRMPLFFC